jgi:hypothetical protein
MAIRIPIVENQAGVPATTFRDPASAAAPWRALEGFGQDIQGAANRLMQQEAELREKKKRIEDANFLSELNLSLAEDNEKIIEEEKKSPDPGNYFTNWQTKFKKVAQARVDTIKDPELKARAKLEATQFEVGEIRTQKHYGNVLWLQTQQARTERILDGHAKRGDKESGLRQIENDVLNGILTPTQGEDQKKKFGKSVEDYEEVKADQAIGLDPARAVIDLQGGEAYPYLGEKSKQAKIEKAKAAAVIVKNRRQKEAKEQEKKVHDKEEQDLWQKLATGKLYLADLQVATHLTADERDKWWKRIEELGKKKDEEIDPVVEAAEYSRLNELITKVPLVSADVIKDSIIYSQRLSKGNRDKLLDRVDKETDQYVKDAKNRGYQVLKGLIIPSRGMMADVIQTPLEQLNYSKAQDELDNWISNMRLQKKTFAADDLRKKAEEIGAFYQVPIDEKIEYESRTEKELLEAEKKDREKRRAEKEGKPVNTPAPVKEQYEVNKVYTDAQGRKAKYLGQGKWELVK